MPRMKEEEKVNSFGFICTILLFIPLTILSGILIHHYSDASLFSKFFLWIFWICVSFLFSFVLVFILLAERIEKAKENDQFNSQPIQRIKLVLKENPNECITFMEEIANEILEVISNIAIPISTDFSRGFREVKMTNEKMYDFLQKQSDFLANN